MGELIDIEPYLWMDRRDYRANKRTRRVGHSALGQRRSERRHLSLVSPTPHLELVPRPEPREKLIRAATMAITRAQDLIEDQWQYGDFLDPAVSEALLSQTAALEPLSPEEKEIAIDRWREDIIANLDNPL